MQRPPSRTLKSKLLQITVTIMLLVSMVTLASVTWTNYVTEGERLADVERQIAASISSKAVTLTQSHALALQGLVADNAFSDVRDLLASTPKHDSDLVYGLFVGADGKPWAYVSPASREHPAQELSPEEGLRDLSLDARQLAVTDLVQRRVTRFGQEVLECQAPVRLGDGEWLGTIVYGFSNRRTLAAMEAARERSSAALTSALLTSGAAVFVSLLLGIAWVMRSATKVIEPVAQLTRAANEIAEGKRGLRAAIQSGDEVEVLASAFNQMVEANEDAMRKLEQTTERALAADRLKSEFLANMSHEIRTPMNGVLGMTRLIRGMPLDGKLRRYIETIDASASALLTIINDILDFSKMEAGKYSIQSVAFQPRVVVQEVAELLASRAHDKGIELIYRIDPELPELTTGDPDRLRQILNNLVGNAIKFTERGDVFIDVNVSERAETSLTLSVSIHDTGIGIAEHDMSRLFEAFSQVDGTMVRRHGGTGLGLAICKRLVEMMHGSIRVQSTPGEGSVFTFTVQLGVERATAARPVRPRLGTGNRVLVVDTNRRWRDVTEEHLRAWGMASESVASGAEALERLKAEARHGRPFDAAVISADLTDLPGAEVVRAIRAEAELRRLPLILLTALADGTPLSEVEAELVAQLSKPLRFSELYNCLTGSWSSNLKLSSAHLPKAGAQKPQKPILVVDDNEINRFVAVEELERRGYLTEVAVNGQDAVERFQSGDYLCVLMDCQMPVMDGYEASRAVRRFEAERGRRRTPIIALTAHALAGERERVLEAGMDDFLSKPFRPSSLERLLRLHIDQNAPASERPETVAAVSDLDPNITRPARLTQLFLDRVPVQLEELSAATERADGAGIRAHAHKLKGSCLAVGAERMAKTAEAIQHHGETSAVGDAAVAFRQLQAQFEVVRGLLHDELARTQGGSLAPQTASVGT